MHALGDQLAAAAADEGGAERQDDKEEGQRPHQLRKLVGRDHAHADALPDQRYSGTEAERMDTA